MEILFTNIDKLHALSNVLLEREILDSEEIDKVLRGEQLPAIIKNDNGSPNNTDVSTPAVPLPIVEQQVSVAVDAQQKSNGKSVAKLKSRSRAKKS